MNSVVRLRVPTDITYPARGKYGQSGAPRQTDRQGGRAREFDAMGN